MVWATYVNSQKINSKLMVDIYTCKSLILKTSERECQLKQLKLRSNFLSPVFPTTSLSKQEAKRISLTLPDDTHRCATTDHMSPSTWQDRCPSQFMCSAMTNKKVDRSIDSIIIFGSQI